MKNPFKWVAGAAASLSLDPRFNSVWCDGVHISASDGIATRIAPCEGRPPGRYSPHTGERVGDFEKRAAPPLVHVPVQAWGKNIQPEDDYYFLEGDIYHATLVQGALKGLIKSLTGWATVRSGLYLTDGARHALIRPILER